MKHVIFNKLWKRVFASVTLVSLVSACNPSIPATSKTDSERQGKTDFERQIEALTVNLGNMLDTQIHVAHLETDIPFDFIYKLGKDHVAASTNGMRDISQGNYTTASGGRGAYRFLTKGQQPWARGCSVLLLAPNFPMATNAWVEAGDFNQTGGFKGFPNFNDASGEFRLLSTPNMSFQSGKLSSTHKAQGSSLKYLYTFRFIHKIPPDMIAFYQSIGIPNPEEFLFQAVTSHPLALTGMGNLVQFTNSTTDLDARTKDTTVNYLGGFFSLAWAGDTASQDSELCQMMDLNMDAGIVGEHGGLLEATQSDINLADFTFSNKQSGAGTITLPSNNPGATLKDIIIQML